MPTKRNPIAAYLAAPGAPSLTEFAAALGVSKQRLSGWRDGLYWPRPEFWAGITQASKGKIGRVSLERAKLAALAKSARDKSTTW